MKKISGKHFLHALRPFHSILAPLGISEAVIIQQLIVGAEYGADILFDGKCEYKDLL